MRREWLALGTMLVAACDAGGYRVVVAFEPAGLSESVTRVEVALVESCDAQPMDGGDPVSPLREIAITRDGASGVLGSVRAGTYGLYARGRSDTCSVIAAGCATVKLVEGGEGVLRVTLEPVAGSGCDAPETCVGSACVAPGMDAGTLDSGGVDAGSFDAAREDTGLDASERRDAGCTADDDRCVGSTKTACGPGGLVVRGCPLGCSADGVRCQRVDPSNVDPALTDPAAPDAAIAAPATWDTDTCDALPSMTVAPQGDGSMVCVVRVGAFQLDATLTVRGARPLVVLAEGDVVLAGEIDVSARANVEGPGGYGGGALGHADGYGPRYGRGGRTADGDEDGGGGGAGGCADGGRGGRADLKSSAEPGRAAPVTWELEPLVGGSGGGAGPSDVPPRDAALGGAGGGALQITAQGSIEVRGRILAGGGGGGAGLVTSGYEGAGGGGGSGGSVLLEAPSITFAPAGGVVTSGGGGGAGIGRKLGATAGQDGAESATRPLGGTSGGGGGDGGDGGGATAAAGEPGGDADLNGGGGGGGAGCILMRTGDGAMPSGEFSPSSGTGLRTLTVVTY